MLKSDMLVRYLKRKCWSQMTWKWVPSFTILPCIATAHHKRTIDLCDSDGVSWSLFAINNAFHHHYFAINVVGCPDTPQCWREWDQLLPYRQILTHPYSHSLHFVGKGTIIIVTWLPVCPLPGIFIISCMMERWQVSSDCHSSARIHYSSLCEMNSSQKRPSISCNRGKCQRKEKQAASLFSN